MSIHIIKHNTNTYSINGKYIIIDNNGNPVVSEDIELTDLENRVFNGYLKAIKDDN
ncbi:MAG: hypothetical protein KGV59_06225 [Tenacibaculum sp.]|nr:hypothetical protein [Tenacibaculum sp.]